MWKVDVITAMVNDVRDITMTSDYERALEKDFLSEKILPETKNEIRRPISVTHISLAVMIQIIVISHTHKYFGWPDGMGHPAGNGNFADESTMRRTSEFLSNILTIQLKPSLWKGIIYTIKRKLKKLEEAW